MSTLTNGARNLLLYTTAFVSFKKKILHFCCHFGYVNIWGHFFQQSSKTYSFFKIVLYFFTIEENHTKMLNFILVSFPYAVLNLVQKKILITKPRFSCMLLDNKVFKNKNKQPELEILNQWNLFHLFHRGEYLILKIILQQ